MNVLLLGNGGRECAFAWKISQSKLLTKLWIAPGNAGTLKYGENINISPLDFEALANFILKEQIVMLIVGPEEPLVKGIRNYFESKNEFSNLIIIGPDEKGAMLEGSKAFSKNFMKKYDIPTAQYKNFSKHEINQAKSFIDSLASPYVIKADGLAAGKGVVISNNKEDAYFALDEMLLDNKFGAASNNVVIEEFLHGIEVSVFVLTDGNSYIILPEAKDYKRIGDGDTGLNTGGMGAVSPVPFVNKEFIDKVEKQIIKPTIIGLKNEGIIYKGFIFIGLMNCNGEPYVIEYNCRMGDPETEVVIPRLKNDILEIFRTVGENKLNDIVIDVDKRFCATVVTVSGGYPGDYEKNKEILGLDKETESMIFHSGTTLVENKVVTNGGRVLAVTSFGETIENATNQSYKAIQNICYDNIYFRNDIGKDLL